MGTTYPVGIFDVRAVGRSRQVVGCALASAAGPRAIAITWPRPGECNRAAQEVDMRSDEDQRDNRSGGVPMPRRLRVLGYLAAGCSNGSGSYQAALPTRDAVAIRVPGAGASASASSVRTETLGAQATFYTMTRQIS